MLPLQKNRTLVIKDKSQLEKYGFIKENGNYCFYTGNKGKYGSPVWTILIYPDNSAPYICSHGNITLEVICRMYADGVIAFEDNNTIQRHISAKEKRIKELEREIEHLKGELKDYENK